VWSDGGGNWIRPWLDAVPGGAVTGTAIVGGAVGGPIYWPWWGSNSGALIAFDVSDPTAPRFASEVNLEKGDQWWNSSPAIAVDGLVYLSHQSSDFMEGVLPPGEKPPQPVVTYDKASGQYITNQPPIGTWVQRYDLDVVDYADPSAPTVRPPVNIPGALKGVSHHGALIYTIGNHWDSETWSTDWTEWLDASAYDGVMAHLVDSMHLPADWPHPVAIEQDSIFLGVPNASTGTGVLQTWTLSDAGRFTALGKQALASPAQTLKAIGSLLAVQVQQGVTLMDVTDASNPKAIGKGDAPGCLGFNLDQADGTVDRGLWIPLNDFGVASIPVAR
jgi:hypothetical protein